MAGAVRVLIVDDSKIDTMLLVRELERYGYTVTSGRVDTAENMSAALDRQVWDVIVSDYVMPQFSGVEALELFKKKGLDLPFIVTSGRIGEDIAVEAMKAGAHDYIMKSSLSRLGPAIERELREAQGRRDRKKAEAQRQAEHEDRLQAYQKLAEVGRLSGSIAHELRNPLATIGSSAYYLSSKLKGADRDTYTHLERIQLAVERCSKIIQGLLDEARVKEPSRRPVDLRSVAANVLSDGRVPDTIKVVCDFPQEKVMVEGDPDLLSIAFQNIVKNAAEAIEETGKAGTINVTIRADAKQVELSFRDTGPGISQENLPRLFQPLFSTKEHGVGFGLSVASMIVGKHGGGIEVKSESGSGATFIVWLPLAQRMAQF